MKKLLLFTLLALALAACARDVVSGQIACDNSVAPLTEVTGECARTYDELENTATQTISVPTSEMLPFATVEYLVIVKSGTVDVTFTDSRGNPQTDQAAPGDPLIGSVRVQLDGLNQFHFDLTPVGGAAKGVEYQLNYACACLP